MDEKITVIIPHYNQPEYIDATIDSILKQTLKPYEIIILDASVPVLDASKYEHMGIRVEIMPEDCGIGYSRNEGYKLATGDWITYLSADDLWHPDFLKKCMKLVKEHDVKAVYTDYRHIDALGKITGDFREVHLPNRTDFCIHAWQRCNVMFSAFVCHREVFVKIDGYDPSLRYGEDYLFLLKAMKHYEFYHSDEMLAYYRLHAGQVTVKKKVDIVANDRKIKDIARGYWNESYC